MSVILKGNSNVSSNNSEKIIPNEVKNVHISGFNMKVYIKFSDPDDVIINDSTLSVWNKTVLVRNDNHVPTSVNDGTTIISNTSRNKYKTTAYIDSNLTNNKIYYYRFFTYDNDKCINFSSNMIFQVKVLVADPILKNNDWATINAVAESGNASSIWNIGDEVGAIQCKIPKDINKDFTNSDNISTTDIVFQIWDFNHYDKADGSGKAGIVFGMKYLYDKFFGYMKSDRTDNTDLYGGWTECDARLFAMPFIYENMPSELKPYIKTVGIYSNNEENYKPDEVYSEDKIFIPGFAEINAKYDSLHETKQTRFSCFTDDASVNKGVYWGENNISSGQTYVTRSTQYGVKAVAASTGTWLVIKADSDVDIWFNEYECLMLVFNV